MTKFQGVPRSQALFVICASSLIRRSSFELRHFAAFASRRQIPEITNCNDVCEQQKRSPPHRDYHGWQWPVGERARAAAH